jgi:hypothetical protein
MTADLSAMTDQCCYGSGNCSILILPRLIYSGGDLAAAIILTAFLVAGISVAIYIAIFYWIYKKKLQPRMVKTAGESAPRQLQPKRSRSARATGEGIAEVGQMTYEFMPESDESTVTTGASKSSKPLPAPKLKQNLAYGKVDVKMPEAELK